MASLLDPFAGGGGIVREALLHSLAVFSADIDPVLRHGLSQMGAAHCIADARRLPFASESIEAVATEPPYHQDAWQAVEESLAELRRILKPEGRVAVLCALDQAEGLRQAGQSLNLIGISDFTIERKGTDCAALVWEKG